MQATHFSRINFFARPLMVLTLLALSAALGGCAVHYNNIERKTVEHALKTGQAAHLSGKLRYLYQQEARRIKVENALKRRDPSKLKRLDLALYNKELKKEIRLLEKQRVANIRLAERVAEQKQADKKRQAESDRLAAIALKEEQQRQADLEAQLKLQAQQRKLRAQERQLEQARKESLALQRKTSQPLYPQWKDDLQLLTGHFKKNGFEPANRLSSVYARTMQFLAHSNSDAEQFSEFYASLSEVEQRDHERLFRNTTGQGLISQFWSSQERSSRLPGFSSNL